MTLTEYFMSRDLQYKTLLTDELRRNAIVTISRANRLLAEFGDTRRLVRSGWRPPDVNAQTPGAAVNSRHMTCEAVDIDDPDGDLDEWALDRGDLLAEIELWQEHPAATKGWAHFQIVPPKSGKRVFYP